MEASHAVMRRTASMKSNAISGTREISTLSQTCPAGSRTCSNIALFLSHVQTRRSIARDAHTESVREQSRDSIPEFQCRKKTGQSNTTNNGASKEKFTHREKGI